ASPKMPTPYGIRWPRSTDSNHEPCGVPDGPAVPSPPCFSERLAGSTMPQIPRRSLALPLFLEEAEAGARSSGLPRVQLPVAANQAPPGEVTNTIGAMQGLGRATAVSTSALPSELAGNGSVRTLLTAADPDEMVWQLTMARKLVIGLVP